MDGRTLVKYTSSSELKYDEAFKAAMDSDVTLAEAVYNVGFDTGEITFEKVDYNVESAVVRFLMTIYINALPDEQFIDPSELGDAETMPYEE